MSASTPTTPPPAAAAAQPIPVYTDLATLHGSAAAALDHAERWSTLADEFARRFGRPPAYIARAPGRVNLIGDHIDYALFGVLPAATERDILVACAPRGPPHPAAKPEPHHAPGGVVAENLHARYARQVFAPSPRPRAPDAGEVSEEEGAVHVEGWHLDIDTAQLRWESYVKAGYYGVLERFFAGTRSHPVPVDLLVTGAVPAGAGLSSSAAMVVASTLAFLAVNGKLSALTKGELVEMAVENEKRVGVNSGGMDQAASVISQPASALYITFFPVLASEPITLPPAARLVCSHSMVVSDKAVGARTRYNLRVVETLAAARALARALSVPLDEGGKRERVTLREVVGRTVGEDVASGGLDAAGLRAALEGVIPKLDVLLPTDAPAGEQGVTHAEMVALSGLSEPEFFDTYLSWVDVEATRFQLFRRTKHVLEEALRVLRFRDVCTAGASDDAALRELGALMDSSQASSAALSEHSSPELDELTALARRAGAFGSRVTGAGWGGCTVSLVAAERVDAFVAQLRTEYAPYKGLDDAALQEVLFATRPSGGASVYQL